MKTEYLMNKGRNFGWLFISIIILLGCNKEEIEVSNAIKILPLGASRVEGNPPNHHSYRFYLWKLLIESDLTIDLVGNQEDKYDYPVILGQSFDRDHEGHSGATSEDLLYIIKQSPNLLEESDIVLLSSPGGNDLLQSLPIAEAVKNINEIVDLILEANPNVKIVIEKMAPGHSNMMTPQMKSNLKLLHIELEVLVSNYNPDQVFWLDLALNFSDDLLADEVHYNLDGAAFVAEKYFEILENLVE
jgi:lysophospholipase L1-like esterase